MTKRERLVLESRGASLFFPGDLVDLSGTKKEKKKKKKTEYSTGLGRYVFLLLLLLPQRLTRFPSSIINVVAIEGDHLGKRRRERDSRRVGYPV